ncbi:MAG: DUF3108 domain-containing protein [Luminiphilus sp.]|nr:DUF3108 domain-containing protein [Luminiphilus sp.]
MEAQLPIRRLTTGLFLLAGAFLGVTTAPPVAGAEGATLAPYKATYLTKAMGMKVRIERELVTTDEGYRLTSNGRSMLAKIKESARFRLDGENVQGINYQYQLKSVVRRKREVIFLPEAGIIKSLKKDEWSEHKWSEGVLDQLSQQEQLRLDLKSAAQASDAPPDILKFKVVDGSRIKDRRLQFVGRETLSTPMGDVLTLHYKQLRPPTATRRSAVWIAPSLDYLMVRTQHIEDDSTIEISLESLTIAPQKGSH